LDIHIKLDEQSCFDTTIVLNKPAYYSINEVYGNGSNLLYLSPGDDLNIYFDLNDGTKSSYKGTGAEANQYLANFQVYLYGDRAHSFLDGRRNAKSSFELTKSYVDSLAELKINELHKTKELSDEFRKIEKARIFAHLANSYLEYFYSIDGIYGSGNIQEEHKQYLEKIKPDVEGISKNFMSDFSVEDPDIRRVIKKIAVENKMLNAMQGTKVYDYVSYMLMNDLLREECSEENINQATCVLNNIGTSQFAKDLKITVNKYKKLLRGNKAFDIELEDINGKQFHLSDYKGKVLYVDFWATWCGPCIGQKPYFESLKKELNNPEIEFISISLDKKKESWKEFLKHEHSEVKEFIAKDLKKLGDDWQICFIPRFIIIDKDFNIVNASAPLPSSGERIESELNSQVNR
jgi:thiol-disulfide isomerase/thioredoxin